ncbi:MAG: 1-deoxy-D-xylulose-5-phosphate reductoisomerase [Rhodospirillales bacterium]|nr:1-deoxy-D-xylulose-5-phosphate reductoisomerase [Rhodospirillales bacterium]MCB9973138.1 1-deoxy-D-xylulose-5-phosphate reductoisomerase [Rhodospirillales bacterium]
MTKKKINILGATGSVGQSTIDVVAAHRDLFDPYLLSAHSKKDALVAAQKRVDATHAVLTQNGSAELLARLEHPVDITLAAIVGMAGLEPLLKAIPYAKVVAIANKEPLVAAGPLVLAEAKKHGTKILPVDSEHNAVFQVFEDTQRDKISRIILTASGGPFRTFSRDDMCDITPAQAIKHPNWSMGAKISVDSATMMNKALEIIEAHYLFDMPAERIDVLVHPQSVVHSMVEYVDGSVLAQMGAPDMKTPITYALGWPDRLTSPGQKLDFTKVSHLEFESPDLERFPALRLAYECLRDGQAAQLVLNAANEVAVAAFLNGEIGFLQIVETVERVLNDLEAQNISSLEALLDFDKNVRIYTRDVIISQ